MKKDKKEKKKANKLKKEYYKVVTVKMSFAYIIRVGSYINYRV